MRRVIFFGGLALAVFSCTSGGNNTDATTADTGTTATDGPNVAGAAAESDTTIMNMGADTGVGRTTLGGQDTASTRGARSKGTQDSL